MLELVAEQEDVFLGCYSLERLSAYAAITPALWLAAFGAWTFDTLGRREWAFRLGAILGSVLLGAVAVDLVARLARTPRYVERSVAVGPDDETASERRIAIRHRPPNQVYRVRYEDVPETARSYPGAPPGHPPIEGTLTTDAFGFRNRELRRRYDIVAVGDSFTEGSHVDDTQTWPALLGDRLSTSVYNLGASGTDPQRYVSHFEALGLPLAPRIAVFMIYEGNDFKGARPIRRQSKPGVGAKLSLWERFQNAIEFSPAVLGIERAFLDYLAPIGSERPLPGAEILSWMPVAVPPGEHARHYAFKPKRLTRLYVSRDEFEGSFRWRSTARVLEGAVMLAERAGVRLVFAFAPSKPHVVMPLVRDRVPAEHLRAFASFREDDLPPAERFREELFSRMDVPERVLADFCARRGIDFVSPTRALRERAARGDPVYYTYDQHWTAIGHEVVASEIGRHLRSLSEEVGAAPHSAGASTSPTS